MVLQTNALPLGYVTQVDFKQRISNTSSIIIAKGVVLFKQKRPAEASGAFLGSSKSLNNLSFFNNGNIQSLAAELHSFPSFVFFHGNIHGIAKTGMHAVGH